MGDDWHAEEMARLDATHAAQLDAIKREQEKAQIVLALALAVGGA